MLSDHSAESIDLPDLLLVDTNVLGIGSMREYEFRDRSHQGVATGAIHGTFRKLSRLLDGQKGKVPVMLWDDRCLWRDELLPQYKRHRWDKPEQQAFLQSYLAQTEVVQALLRHLGIPQVSCPNFEADDIVGLICRNLEPEWKITLATTDTDWYQALRPNVEWVSLRTGDRVTQADLGNVDVVKDGPFYSADHFVRAKALAGDTSDGIPGVPGVGLKTAAKILGEHGTIEALWEKHDLGHPIKGVALQRAAGTDYRDVYVRNMKLVDWRLTPRLSPDFQVEFGSPDATAFGALCEQWGLGFIAEAWGSFMLPSQPGLTAVDRIRGVLEAAA